MHAVFLARELGHPRGDRAALPRRLLRLGDAGDGDPQGLQPHLLHPARRRSTTATWPRTLGELESEGFDLARGRGDHARDRPRRPRVDVRYVGQEYTLTIPLPSADEPLEPDFDDALADRFHAAHDTRFGHANPGAPVEFVVVRSMALGDLGPRRAGRAEDAADEASYPSTTADGDLRPRDQADARWSSATTCRSGASVDGPAIVAEPTATTVVPPGATLRVDPFGSLVVQRRRGGLNGRPSGAIDPITTEIIRSAFTAAADEMNATLIRSAYTPVIYEMKDCSVALLDAEHQVLGQSAGLPIFLGNLEICTQPDRGDVRPRRLATGRRLDHERLVPDRHPPQRHDGLRSDLPRRRAGRLRRLAARTGSTSAPRTRAARWTRPRSTRRASASARPRSSRAACSSRDVTDLLGRNSRFSYPAIGDLGAQIACARTGQDRLAAIIDRYGLGDDRRGARRDLRPDRALRARGRRGDPGRHLRRRRAASTTTATRPTRAGSACTVEIRGDEMTIDLSETDDAQGGPVNCGEAQAISACRVAYKLLINPHNPPNGGGVPAADGQGPPGLDARARRSRRPASGTSRQLGLLIDLVVKALADVMPEQAAGASYGDSMVISLSGIDHRNGRPWLDLEPTVGGWGAWDGSDGESGLDQQRQRLAQGPHHRGAGDEVPDADDPLRLPHRLRRPRQVARRQRHHPRVHARRRGRDALPLVRALEDAGLGSVRRPGRDAARSS